MAKPAINIDITQFENLCKLQCTEEEIAGWFGCSHDTIERWCKRTYHKNFRDVFAEKRQAGLISLRRSQFRLAESNAAMAIFLGKQYLNQSDDPQRLKHEKAAEDRVGDFIDALSDAIHGA